MRNVRHKTNPIHLNPRKSLKQKIKELEIPQPQEMTREQIRARLEEERDDLIYTIEGNHYDLTDSWVEKKKDADRRRLAYLEKFLA